MNNCKNYSTDGGDKLVIGGELEIKSGAKITGLQAENQSNSTATTVEGLVTDFNALLTKLKNAGLMKTE